MTTHRITQCAMFRPVPWTHHMNRVCYPEPGVRNPHLRRSKCGSRRGFSEAAMAVESDRKIVISPATIARRARQLPQWIGVLADIAIMPMAGNTPPTPAGPARSATLQNTSVVSAPANTHAAHRQVAACRERCCSASSTSRLIRARHRSRFFLRRRHQGGGRATAISLRPPLAPLV